MATKPNHLPSKFPIHLMHPADALVLMLVLSYIVFFSYLSIRSLESLDAFGFDLAINDQAIWNTARGEFLMYTIISDSQNPISLLEVNYSLLLTALAPLYAVWNNVRVLLIAQTVALAVGAFPVYWLARKELGQWLGALFALVYLLFPPLQAGNLFDFHPIVLAVPLLAFAFWFLLRKNNAGFAVTAFLAMHVREQVPIAVGIMALYALAVQRRWKFGFAWTAISGLVFLFANYVVIPFFNPHSTHPLMEWYGGLGTSPLEIAWNAATNPALVLQRLGPARTANYLFDLIYPYGFMSLFAPAELVLILPDVLINQLSNHTTMNRLAAEYPLTMVPFIAMSAVLGARRLARVFVRGLPMPIVRGVITLMLLSGILIAQREHGLTPLSKLFTDYPVSAHAQRIDNVLAMIPPTASVWAQPNLLPFVTHRERIYTWSHLNADYFLFDVATGFNRDDIFHWVRDTLLKDYHVAYANDGYLLLQRGKGNTTLPANWHSFAIVENPTIQNPVHAIFGDTIELLGYDVRSYEWELEDEPQLFLYLRALRPLTKNYRIEPYLLDVQSQVIGTAEWPQATLVWYPTSQWTPGEIVRVRVNTVAWYTGNYPHFGIALGIVEGDDLLDSATRLTPRLIQSPYTTVMPADGTLLQLATFTSDVLMRRRFVPQVRLFDVPSNAVRLEYIFNDQITLAGYSVQWSTETNARVFRAILYWRANSPISAKYTVFTHLVDANGSLIAQHDNQPNHGNTPTTLWLPNEIVTDEHIIQIDPQAERQAQLVVGLYDPTTGVRLQERGGNDQAIITTVEIPR